MNWWSIYRPGQDPLCAQDSLWACAELQGAEACESHLTPWVAEPVTGGHAESATQASRTHTKEPGELEKEQSWSWIRNRTKNGHKSFLLTSYKVHFIFKVKINDRLICGFSLPPCISRRHFKHPEEFCQKLEKKVAVGIWWMEAKSAEKHTAMPT